MSETEHETNCTDVSASDDGELVKIPEFTRQLQIHPCKDLDNWYRIEQKFPQKCIAFGVMFVQGLVLALIALVFLFGADFVMDYAHRGAEFVTFFWKFFGLAVGFLTLCVFAIQAMRNTPIYINPVQKRIVNAAKLTEKLASESLEMSAIESVKVDYQKGLSRRSSLIVRIDEMNITLIDSFGEGDDLMTLLEWINKLRG
ncbi:MAG: hypothetical protein IJU23_02210 [Proteobacteria bacterium]|nr:hypothetical protein [Pseudomonadota bacterium]